MDRGRALTPAALRHASPPIVYRFEVELTSAVRASLHQWCGAVFTDENVPRPYPHLAPDRAVIVSPATDDSAHTATVVALDAAPLASSDEWVAAEMAAAFAAVAASVR